MKTFTKIFTMIFAMTMAVIISNAQSQIQFEGLYTEGEGAVGWDADGSGPEPAANGHGGIYYYIASRDYVDAGSTSGGHMLDNINGFPLFAQALADNCFTPDQVSFTFGLADMGDDIEGIDWFQIGALNYSNFYPITIRMYLAEEPMISAIGNYGIYIVGTGTQEMETGFLKIEDVSAQSSDPVKLVAAAFVSDMAGEELKAGMQVDNAANLTGNGRSGGYFDAVCTFTKGLPTFLLQGLTADNEGSAGWDADGTGPEPYGNGHLDYVYYVASVDYDDINPDPDACLAHFLDGSTGFFNTLLQLQYRGFEIGDLKIKMGLASFGPDAEGEDWGYINGNHWFNEYNNVFTFEINGEPILQMMQDTMKSTETGNHWGIKTSVGKVYDISQGASPEAEFVAQSFLRDLGAHCLEWNITNLNYTGTFSGNGRDGVYYQISEGAITGVHTQATFINAGEVSGTWTADSSPYYVEGHLTIEDGQTLTIEPGVRVGVRGPFHFDVQGCVKAEGTAGEPVMFTASNPNITWDGFDYDATPATNEPSVFDHCIFQYGRAQGGGEYNSGGIFAVRDYDNIEIYNSTFTNNIADQYSSQYVTCGGAIALWNASPIIQKCIFHDNYGLDYAGALIAYMGSNPIISNCLFYNNESPKGGALAFYDNSNGILINSTIANNQAELGGALYFNWYSSPEIINNIIWGNTASVAGNQVHSAAGGCHPGFYYCDIEGGQSGFTGIQINGGYFANLEEDPAFETSPEYPPYMISGASPCIDAGTPDTSAWYYPQYLPETCLCGNQRIEGSCIDIGAYEQLAVSVPDLAEAGNENIVFTASPNPFNSVLNIRFSLSRNSFLSLQVYNAMGVKVDQITHRTFLTGDHTISWQNPALPEGIYFIRLNTNDGSYTKKIMKY